MKKHTLVVYHYFEKDPSYIDNFLHFLALGYSAALDYLVVVAGACTIDLPRLDNVRYLHTENGNNDFGGYTHAVNRAIDPWQYRYFVFVNSSVRGPYTTAYGSACWTSYFTGPMEADPEVGLVGSTINVLSPQSPDSQAYARRHGGQAPFSHVQTMCYAMPRAVLLALRGSGFYCADMELGKAGVIRDYEIRLTQLVLSLGWNIRSLLPEYNHVDYRKPHQDINPMTANGDANCQFGYFGRTVHPFEVIFVKVNRNLFSMAYLQRLSYSLHRARTLPAAIGGSRAFARYIAALEQTAAARVRVDFFVRRKAIIKFIPKPLRPLGKRLFAALA